MATALFQILAQTPDASVQGWRQDLKSLVFLGAFVLLAIIVFIWWMRRS